MSYENFIPELWANQIDIELQKELVFGSLCTRKYEGMIAGAGDTVKVNQLGSPTVRTYVNDTDMTTEQLTNAQKELKIDVQEYINFSVDDVDKVQAQLGTDILSTGGGLGQYELADKMDIYIASLHGQAGIVDTSLGTLASPLSVNSANAIDVFTGAKKKLGQSNVRGRICAVVPYWLEEKINIAEIATLTENRETYTNGFLGLTSGIKIYVSNNVQEASSETNSKVMFFVEDFTIALAQQIVKMRAGTIEKQFGEYIAGLHVYGGKVMRPDTLLTTYLSAGAES